MKLAEIVNYTIVILLTIGGLALGYAFGDSIYNNLTEVRTTDWFQLRIALPFIGTALGFFFGCFVGQWADDWITMKN